MNESITRGRDWKKRVGRPRREWLEQVRGQYWAVIKEALAPAFQGEEFDPDNKIHVGIMLQAAADKLM